ncbi:MAG: hypothetical protein DRI95_15620 [Bacteroidetes bacterium]|nr:MAG: hypothetical protein DRI95_15620 [Bacteroidota bacterium]RLD79962.1 MAG: hypothetical protein DRJ07_11060 [Bacteroidota bacterium]
MDADSAGSRTGNADVFDLKDRFFLTTMLLKNHKNPYRSASKNITLNFLANFIQSVVTVRCRYKVEVKTTK